MLLLNISLHPVDIPRAREKYGVWTSARRPWVTGRHSREVALTYSSSTRSMTSSARAAVWNSPSITSGRTSSWRCAACPHREMYFVPFTFTCSFTRKGGRRVVVHPTPTITTISSYFCCSNPLKIRSTTLWVTFTCTRTHGHAHTFTLPPSPPSFSTIRVCPERQTTQLASSHPPATASCMSFFRSTTELSVRESEDGSQTHGHGDTDIGPGRDVLQQQQQQKRDKRDRKDRPCIVYCITPHARLSPYPYPSLHFSTSLPSASGFRRDPPWCPGSALPWVVVTGGKALLRVRETFVGNER